MNLVEIFVLDGNLVLGMTCYRSLVLLITTYKVDGLEDLTNHFNGSDNPFMNKRIK